MRVAVILLLLLIGILLTAGCSDDDPVTPPPPPEPLGPVSLGALMEAFVGAYADLDHDLYMSLLHPDYEMNLQQETIDQFPGVGTTLDYAEEDQIHARMFSGEDLTDPDTGSFIPGVESITFGVFNALDAWQEAKAAEYPPGTMFCPYLMDVSIFRGQDQSAMRVQGMVRFYAVGIDSLHDGTMQTYYQMIGQDDLTGNKGSESETWGSFKALYR